LKNLLATESRGRPFSHLRERGGGGESLVTDFFSRMALSLCVQLAILVVAAFAAGEEPVRYVGYRLLNTVPQNDLQVQQLTAFIYVGFRIDCGAKLGASHRHRHSALAWTAIATCLLGGKVRIFSLLQFNE